MLDKRADAQDRLDEVRRMLVNEPRGHADMYGCFVAPADDDDAEFAMIFFYKDGFSTACGHGTIAGATWALESGVVTASEPVSRFSVDVPSGRLAVEADLVDGQVGMVRFVNVPAMVRGLDIEVEVEGRTVAVDIAYGGAHYAVLPAASATAEGDLTVEPPNVNRFIELARAIRSQLGTHELVQHPNEPRLSGLYGVIFYDEDPDPPRHSPFSGATLTQRNITVFGDGEVDRSPCGSGTSARLAVLHHRGLLGTGEILSHRGIAGGVFTGRVVNASNGQAITEIGGRASISGHHTFIVDDDDEMGLGFQLR